MDEILSGMSLEEKIAQMIVVRGEDFEERIFEMLDRGEVGAIGAAAIPDTELSDVVSKINRYKARAKRPLFFYLDAEWGVAQKYRGATRIPPQMVLGAARSPELSYECGKVIATEARALGYRVLGSPTLDVNTNPKNPIINTRAFSDQTDLVIDLARAYIKGMQDMGVITGGKHYPGHGDTAEDSHVEMPTVSCDKETVWNRELLPYRVLANELWGVMTAHIFFPALCAENEEEVPATLSRTVIHDILRDEIGFQGIIISDSLTMKGIRLKYGLDAAVYAIRAGHDLILQDYMSDPKLTFDRVVQAVKEGTIPMEYIDDSVLRILNFKKKLGLLDNKQVDKEEALRIVGCAEHAKVAQKIADAGVTLIEGAQLPLDPKNCKKTLVISTVAEEEGGVISDFGLSDDSSSARVLKAVSSRAVVDCMRIHENPSDEEIEELISKASNYDNIIFASFIRVVAYKETSGSVTESQIKLIRTLSSQNSNFVFLIFGSPYVLADLPKMDNCLVAYGDDEYCIEAGVRAMFGEIKPQGKLPVMVNKEYPFGYAYNK